MANSVLEKAEKALQAARAASAKNQVALKELKANREKLVNKINICKGVNK